MTTTIDTPFLELTADLPTRPLPSALATARDDVLAAARDLLAIPEAALPKPWAWKGGSEEEVRYGAYRAAELMEAAELEARRLMAPLEATERRAARLVGPTTAARWDLHGVLLPLEDALLDADPGGGEWTIRLTLGHIISGQRGYGWGSAWWQTQSYAADDPALPARAPDSLRELLPDEATTEAAGTLDDLRARLDAVTDLTSERLAGMPDDRVDLGSRWAGFAVTLGFRFGRWSSHIREHVDPGGEDVRDARARAERAGSPRAQPAGRLRARRIDRLRPRGSRCRRGADRPGCGRGPRHDGSRPPGRGRLTALRRPGSSGPRNGA